MPPTRRQSPVPLQQSPDIFLVAAGQARQLFSRMGLYTLHLLELQRKTPALTRMLNLSLYSTANCRNEGIEAFHVERLPLQEEGRGRANA